MDEKTKKEILETLKVEGLDIAEDLAVVAVRSAFALIKLLVPKISSTGGAMASAMLAIVEPKILELLDKIDGEDDKEY